MATILILSILIGLDRFYVCGVCQSVGIVRFHVRPKKAMTAILILSILIKRSYFQLKGHPLLPQT